MYASCDFYGVRRLEEINKTSTYWSQRELSVRILALLPGLEGKWRYRLGGYRRMGERGLLPYTIWARTSERAGKDTMGRLQDPCEREAYSGESPNV